MTDNHILSVPVLNQAGEAVSLLTLMDVIAHFLTIFNEDDLKKNKLMNLVKQQNLAKQTVKDIKRKFQNVNSTYNGSIQINLNLCLQRKQVQIYLKQWRYNLI